jgi:hypothetical protein
MSENPFFSAFFEGFKPARQRERAAYAICRALEARNAVMQDVGGGSPAPAPRAPRTQRRAAARKPAIGDDGDGEPAPRYSLSATAHNGFIVETADGRQAKLCVIDEDGSILSDDVSVDAFKVAIAAYRNFLQGTGHLKVHASPPGLPKA